MSCTPTSTPTELDFVQALYSRLSTDYSCAGPLVHMSLWPWRVFTLERIFDNAEASDLLWSGFLSDGYVGVHFSLCAAHWMDLACLTWIRATQSGRPDSASEAQALAQDLCFSAGWDVKEIVNMLAWRRARLT